MRFFNTAGPVKRNKHYELPPLSRFDLTEIVTLIEQEKYFVLHAPRQSGKTSCLLALMDYLNRQEQYRCLYLNLEIVQAKPEDVRRNICTIIDEIVLRARDYMRDGYPESVAKELQLHLNEERILGELLGRWSAHSPKPLVLLMDEIDSLMSDTLIAVLRQLRSGYPRRPRLFPQSIILCGVRDVRQYRIYSSQEKNFITGGGNETWMLSDPAGRRRDRVGPCRAPAIPAMGAAPGAARPAVLIRSSAPVLRFGFRRCRLLQHQPFQV